MLFTIDIGGTFIKYGLMDRNYHIVHTDKIPTPATIEEFWQGLEGIVAPVQEQIEGIAISCPGEIQKSLGFVFRGGLIPYLRNIPLASRLKQTFHLPVTVINDGEAAGLAEGKAWKSKRLFVWCDLGLGDRSWPCSSF